MWNYLGPSKVQGAVPMKTRTLNQLDLSRALITASYTFKENIERKLFGDSGGPEIGEEAYGDLSN